MYVQIWDIQWLDIPVILEYIIIPLQWTGYKPMLHRMQRSSVFRMMSAGILVTSQ